MNPNLPVYPSEESLVLKLRDLYEKYGYFKLKTNKFEKYSFYLNSKHFFNDDKMITFTDFNGNLLALKPDNTFSIAKNSRIKLNQVRKIYYNDSIYRVCEKNKGYEKINQSGIECIGDIDFYNIYEVVGLAAESLQTISDECILNISHLGVVLTLLKDFNIEQKKLQLFKFIEGKNIPGVKALCNIVGIPQEIAEQIFNLISTYGPAKIAIPKLIDKMKNVEAIEYLNELQQIVETIQNKTKVKFIVDMSITTGFMNYYDGLIFKGFVKNIPSHVLMGGQYTKLLKHIGKPGRAIGFSVYLDLINNSKSPKKYDIDIFLLYDLCDNLTEVYEKVCELVKQGNSVYCGKNIDKSLKPKVILKFSEIKDGGS